jgi:hypothetical protein
VRRFDAFSIRGRSLPARVLLGSVALAAAACSSRSNGGAPPENDAGDDVTTPPPATDAGDAGDASAVDASPPQTFLRVAHASPDAPAFDLCVAPHGTTTFQGPLIGLFAAGLRGDAGPLPEAGPTGVSFGQVSAYLPLAPGQYDVRLVPAGGGSCTEALVRVRPLDVSDGGGEAGEGPEAGPPTDAATDAADASPSDAALVDATVDAGAEGASPGEAGVDGAIAAPDWTDLPTLAFDVYTTLLVAGDLSPTGSDAPLTAAMMTDDAVLTGGAVVLRAINAVPSAPSLDFGLGPGSGADAGWLPLLTDVRFGAASTQAGPGEGALDANGYLPIAPLNGQTVAARASSSDASADVAVAGSVTVDLGSIATVIAIGGKTGDAAHPPALLWCTDNQPTGYTLGDCSVEQP